MSALPDISVNLFRGSDPERRLRQGPLLDNFLPLVEQEDQAAEHTHGRLPCRLDYPWSWTHVQVGICYVSVETR